jgi:hypothetical protein
MDNSQVVQKDESADDKADSLNGSPDIHGNRLSETPDDYGAPVKPLLQPAAYQLLDQRPGYGDQKENAEEVGEKTGGQKEHTPDQHHGAVHKPACGELSHGKLRLDAPQSQEALGADQPCACGADGQEEKHRRKRADNLTGFDDKIDLYDRDKGE